MRSPLSIPAPTHHRVRVHLQWPICDTPEAFEKQRPRFKHLRSDLVEALEAIQPYQAELPAWNSLRILNELARVDRHR